ncbi:MAG: SirB2 family protein [Gammaproteobacteria bacterium]|nr:SirB2 family protein [Gammaproteobacteria bacterium]
MHEYYLQIKMVHVVAVFASGTLFLIRGLMVQADRQTLALSAQLRYLSYTIDTVLLLAALLLLTVLPGAAYANGWLVAKITLLLAYIVLGSFALKRAATQRTRLWFFIAALLTYGLMLTIAWTHNPLGFLSTWIHA